MIPLFSPIGDARDATTKYLFILNYLYSKVRVDNLSKLERVLAKKNNIVNYDNEKSIELKVFRVIFARRHGRNLLPL